jgi:hypothetical protein
MIRSLTPCLILMTALCLQGWQAQAQTVLFGGDYVTGNVTNARVLNGNGSPTFQVAADGGTDSLPFNLTTAASPGSGYTGPVFYSGINITNTGTSAVRVNPSGNQRVTNSGTADLIRFGLSGDGQTATETLIGSYNYALALALPSAYNLTGLSITFSRPNNSVNDVGRLLISNGTDWYVSNTTLNAGTLNPNFGTETWSTFNTSTLTATAATLALPSDITYVGFYLAGTYNRNGNVATSAIFEELNISNITFTGVAIPEPSTYALILGGLGALVVLRRWTKGSKI